MRENNLQGRSGQRGSAMLVVITFVMLVAALGTAVLLLDMQTGKSRRSSGSDQRAFYAAEAAISEAYVALLQGTVDPGAGETIELGTSAAPRDLGNSRFWAQVSRLDTRRFALVGTGRDGGSQVRQQLVVSHAPNGLFQYAAFGGAGVELASNAFVDSFDSAFGDYASQVAAGTDYARQNGTLGSNGDVRLRSNTRVYGDCHPGPSGVVYDTAPGVVVTGSTAPGPEIIALPAIEPPAGTSLGDAALAATTQLGPGVVRYDALSLGGGATLTIRGPAQLVVDSFHMSTGTTLVLEASGGPIEIHAAGDFVLESNTDVISRSDSAVDVKLFLSGNNMSGPMPQRNDVSLASNSAFIGAIYAPNAELQLGSNFEIYGSVMAGGLDLSSNGRIHFDEALLYDGSGQDREFVTVHWGRLQGADA